MSAYVFVADNFQASIKLNEAYKSLNDILRLWSACSASDAEDRRTALGLWPRWLNCLATQCTEGIGPTPTSGCSLVELGVRGQHL